MSRIDRIENEEEGGAAAAPVPASPCPRVSASGSILDAPRPTLHARTDPAALVVGAGLAGMQAALLLAAAGSRVYLADRAPALGGHQPLLDRTFPTDSCGLCFMSPRPAAYCPFVECERDPRITVLPSTEVLSLSGDAGDFSVRLLERARGVDPRRCTGCGRCAAVCPIDVRDDFAGGLETRRAIYRPYLQAVPDSFLVDWQACNRCGECAKVCPAGAVALQQGDAERTVRVGAVILATGFKPVDAALNTEYGFGLYPNVVTGLQLERMLSRGGPTGGEVRRPSDSATPARMAFLQCVGSRDPARGRGYCSSICCTYAAKQTALIKERHPGAQVVVFQRDLRSVGKGYERYVRRIQALPGVEYRRSAVGAVKQVPGSKDLVLDFVDGVGAQRQEVFSMVVLSVGMEPSAGVGDLAARLGLPLTHDGFVASSPLFHEQTPAAGVFVAGGAREPVDIADAVAEGAAAAASAAAVLGLGIAERAPLPPALLPARAGRGVETGEPRVAVLLCNCGGEVGGALDLEALAARVGAWPEVVHASVEEDLCGDDVSPFRRAIGGGANRLVVAACARRRIEDRFGALAAGAGFEPGTLETVNLREQCVWVHAGDGAAQIKAELLVAMGVARGALLEPTRSAGTDLPATALVVGGGAAGMVAATTLADLGVEVWLAERARELGGDLRRRATGPEAGLLEGLRRRAETSDRVHLLLDGDAVRTEGQPGSFRSTVLVGGEERRLQHSVLMLATGVEEFSAGGHSLGQHAAVITQRELARLLEAEAGWALGHPRVAIVLCAGDPGEDPAYCSRTCCSEGVVNALRVKERNPKASVYVLHREMRTYGFQEAGYEAARRAGVVFLRYAAGKEPEVAIRDRALEVLVAEPHLGCRLALPVEALVVAGGYRPRPAGTLAGSLGVQVDADGFFVEANVKTRSTEARRPGVFLCGTCQAPRSLPETLTHARAAAMRAFALLRPGRTSAPSTVATVNDRICSGCGLCVESCVYGARVLDPERNVSSVLDGLCQGCGACAAACPNGATQQQGFNGRQMVAVLDAALG